ncbi:MAG: beta-lactamase family protein [Planctomycetes bacterium]|nr:beta-lactamase family protein [Planctomycetota bacterium]
MLYKPLFLAILAQLLPATAMASQSSDFVRQVNAALPPHVGACVLAIDGGHVVFEHATGVADIESKTPCTTATNFRMASVSKQFTATAVLLLVDRRKLSLDDALENFFPGFPEYARKITVKHLLTHTSGLRAYEDLIPEGTTLQLDDLDVLQLLMDAKEPRFAAGEKFEYSNSGYALLGLIVEIAADKPFHEFMADEVLRPLGMNDSVLYQRGLNEVPRRAFGHSRKNEDWVQADQSLTSAIRGDGAIYTSVRDYQKWLAGIEGQKLLAPESYKAMFAPHVVTDCNGSQYGYGWFIDSYRGEPRIHHNGDTRGFRLCVQRFPQRRAALLVQLNSETDGESEQMTKLGERLADLLIFDRPR